MFVYCAIVVAAYLFYKWATLNNDYFEKRGIPYSKPTFLLGSNPSFLFKKMSLPELSEKLYNKLKHEKISGQFEFLKPIFFVCDPKLIKKITVKDFDHFVDHRMMMDDTMDKMLGNVLLNLRGQKWKDMRATLSPMFTGSKMREMFKYVTSVANQATLTIKDQIKSGGDNEFEFKALTSKFTVDVIASCVFGIECNSFENPDNEFHKIAMIISNFANFKTMLKFVGYLISPSMMKTLKITMFGKEVENFFRETVHETMRIREERGIVRHDMINLMMQVKKGTLKHEDEEKIIEGFSTVEESHIGKSHVKTVFTDEELAAQAFIFFFAGFEPISVAMSFMGYELAVNADVQQRLYDEVRDMNEQLDGKTVSYEQIHCMKYMDQVVCEVLRMRTVPIMDRLCVKDYEIESDGKKITIEKGKVVIIPIYPIQNDPLYYPNPTKFDPERFSDENKSKIDPDTYMPFSVGPRNCIGSRFALMEIKTMFYYLLLNFSIEVTSKTQIPIQLKKTIIGLRTEKGIWIALKPRE